MTVAIERRKATTSYTATYGVVHDVLLRAAATVWSTPESLRMLLAIAERGGSVEGASETLVGDLGSNATAIRRSALTLAADGLVTNRSQRGVGMRLTLTDRGRSLTASMLRSIEDGLAEASLDDEAVAA